MNCPACGARLPARPVSRMIVTGALFIAAGMVLLFLLHLAIIVLASVLLVAIGATLWRSAFKVRAGRCPACGRKA